MRDILESIEQNFNSIEEVLDFLDEFDSKYVTLKEEFVVKHTDFQTLEEFNLKIPVDLKKKEYDELSDNEKEKLNSWISKNTDFDNFRQLMERQTLIEMEKYTE